MWSKKFENCIDCGTSEKRHIGKGLCMTCYARKQYKKNPKRRLQIKKAIYKWRKKASKGKGK